MIASQLRFGLGTCFHVVPSQCSKLPRGLLAQSGVSATTHMEKYWEPPP